MLALIIIKNKKMRDNINKKVIKKINQNIIIRKYVNCIKIFHLLNNKN